MAAYAGDPKFAGLIRNERALFAHARAAFGERTTLWTNVDVVRRLLLRGGNTERLVSLTRIRRAGKRRLNDDVAAVA